MTEYKKYFFDQKELKMKLKRLLMLMEILHLSVHMLVIFLKSKSSSEGLDECEIRIRRDLNPTTWPGSRAQQNKNDVFLSRRDLLYVINKCRSPMPNLINLKECLGTELHKNKWLCKGQETLDQIMQAFNGD